MAFDYKKEYKENAYGGIENYHAEICCVRLGLNS